MKRTIESVELALAAALETGADTTKLRAELAGLHAAARDAEHTASERRKMDQSDRVDAINTEAARIAAAAADRLTTFIDAFSIESQP